MDIIFLCLLYISVVYIEVIREEEQEVIIL